MAWRPLAGGRRILPLHNQANTLRSATGQIRSSGIIGSMSALALCGLKSESSRGQVATPRGSSCLLTTVAPRGLLLGHAAHVFDREIISGGNYAESHRRSDRAHDIDRGDPVDRADAAAGTYHAAIAAGRACGQPDDQ